MKWAISMRVSYNRLRRWLPYKRRRAVSRNYQGLPWHREEAVKSVEYPVYAKEWFDKLQSMSLEVSSEIVDNMVEVLNNIKVRKYVDKKFVFNTVMVYMKEVQAQVVRELIPKVKEFYSEAREGVQKEAGIKIAWSNVDDVLLRRVEEDVFTNVNNSMIKLTNLLREEIFNFISQDVNRNDIRLFIDKVIAIVLNRIATVVRTVVGSYYNEIKSKYFEMLEKALGEKIKYKWVNPMDERTTMTCRNIVNRTAGGVSLEEMINIVREESMRYFPNWWKPERPFSAHPNCRSTLVAIEKFKISNVNRAVGVRI